MMPITIQNKQKKIKIPSQKIQKWMKKLFTKKWGNNAKRELSILFVSDLKIQKLNRFYRGKNKPTDVLSFPLQEGGLKHLNRHIAALGDIVISVDTAKRNAQKFGKTFEEELQFLLIHGFLHLLGYDHEKSKKEEKRMQRQEKILWNILKSKI
ncbi:MAG: rRNA maturation RNase YbeY [Deltaproteobacteria bacterium]|nr:rRNA maturation RNase YbeY [Deltaproteobacteria bacterium]